MIEIIFTIILIVALIFLCFEFYSDIDTYSPSEILCFKIFIISSLISCLLTLIRMII